MQEANKPSPLLQNSSCILFHMRRKAVKAVSRPTQTLKSAELRGKELSKTEKGYFYLFSFAACITLLHAHHVSAEVLNIRLLALVLMFETGIFICLVRGKVTKW